MSERVNDRRYGTRREPVVPSDHGAPSDLELDSEQMRSLGYRVVDALVERWTGLEKQVAWRGAGRTETEARLAGPAPERGRAAEEAIETAIREILPLAGSVDHPRFFAFVPSAPTWPGVLGDFLAAGFNTFQGTWLESAGPSQIELVVLDWFRTWLELPDGAGGVLTSGGSAASLIALAAARERAGAPERPSVYLTEQGHSSLARAARTVGVREEGIRAVGMDDALRMRPELLRKAIAADRQAGWTPVAVLATAGATNTGAIDPLTHLSEVCAAEDVWLHVDAAYGGFAFLTDRGRRALEGIGRADSVTLDPHKWLYQPYEVGCLMVRDPRTLETAFRVIPEYLQDTELGRRHVNFADRGIQLTRSFRALKIWLSVQTFGTAAFRRAIDRNLDLAEAAGRWIEAHPSLELLSPPSLGIVCYRATFPGCSDREVERRNQAVQERLIGSGHAMVSSTRLAGRYALRLCILSHRTGWRDVESTLEHVVAFASELKRDAADG